MTSSQDEGFGGAAALRERGKLSPSIRSQRVPTVHPPKGAPLRVSAAPRTAAFGGDRRAPSSFLFLPSFCFRAPKISERVEWFYLFIYIFLFFFFSFFIIILIFFSQSPRRAAQNCSTAEQRSAQPTPPVGAPRGPQPRAEGPQWRRRMGLPKTTAVTPDPAVTGCSTAALRALCCLGFGLVLLGGELRTVGGQGGAGRS